MGVTSSMGFAIAMTAVGGLLIGIMIALTLLIRTDRRSTATRHNRDDESEAAKRNDSPEIPLYGWG
jgi:hypothetical protein